MTEPSAALDVHLVVKEYEGTPPVRALDGVSLRVDDGELAAIVGPSGSGKSTLLHILGTLERPTLGRISIDGRNISNYNDQQLSAVRARLIGFVFQQFFLIDGMSAMENVAHGLLYSGVSPRERRIRAAEALVQVGLAHRATHFPNQMSGGERQRVAIARAIVHRPAIVLADEPTGNLDTKSSDAIVELLYDLHRVGTTIVVITHDDALAASLPRRIQMRDGRVLNDSRYGAPAPLGGG